VCQHCCLYLVVALLFLLDLTNSTRALATAFLATHRDPRFLEEAQRLGVDISPVDAAEVLRSIAQMAQAPPDVLAYMRKLLATHKG
jgi:hypothetical protein